MFQSPTVLPFKGQQSQRLAFPICTDCGGYFDSLVALARQPAAHSSHALTQSQIEEEEAILKKGSASANERKKKTERSTVKTQLSVSLCLFLLLFISVFNDLTPNIKNRADCVHKTELLKST